MYSAGFAAWLFMECVCSLQGQSLLETLEIALVDLNQRLLSSLSARYHPLVVVELNGAVSPISLKMSSCVLRRARSRPYFGRCQVVRFGGFGLVHAFEQSLSAWRLLSGVGLLGRLLARCLTTTGTPDSHPLSWQSRASP